MSVAFLAEEVEQIQDLFNSYDEDGSGKIPNANIIDILEELNFVIAASDIALIQEELNSRNAGGMFTLEDLGGIISRLRDEPEGYAELLESFRVFDPNKTGRVNFKHLMEVLENVEEQDFIVDLGKVHQILNPNDDEMIEYEPIVKFITGKN